MKFTKYFFYSVCFVHTTSFKFIHSLSFFFHFVSQLSVYSFAICKSLDLDLMMIISTLFILQDMNRHMYATVCFFMKYNKELKIESVILHDICHVIRSIIR